MKVKKNGEYYVVRLEKGEEIITSLQEAYKRAKLRGAFFFGLGVGKDVVLGYFDAHKKSYHKKAFHGEYEFTSLVGNIARCGDDIIVHCHVTITDRSFNAYGGHLFHAVVPATCELVLMPLSGALIRKTDKRTGLKLLDL